jgi:segregation and condensation protein A
MASSLLEIKSRLLLPRPEEIETEPEITEDPRSELIQQLLEYKKLKDAARALEEHAAAWQERYPRLSDDRPGHVKDPTADRIKEVELWDLVSALSRILRRNVVQKEGSIRYDETPIQVYMDQIGERVRSEGRVAFGTFFDKETLRSKIVGMFLAILELLRHHDFRAEQPVDFGEIWLLPPAGVASPQEADTPPVSPAR